MTAGSTILYVPTADGAQIAVKRKPASGAPVIFLHGLAVNADIWDSPEIRGSNFVFRSLPTILHEAGHDIWLVNLRGHGAPHMLSKPPEKQLDWCVDHFILYDLPAVLEQVAKATGKRPFLIGNSMGAMTIAACMQGAALIGYGADQAIIADEAAARRRQADVAGCVLVEFPAALRWPRSMFDSGSANWSQMFSEWRQSDAGSNLMFEMIARWPWLEAGIEAAGSIRLDWLRPRRPTPAVVDATGGDDFGARLKTAAMRWFSEKFKSAQHFQAETFTNGLLRAVDHMKSGVLRQMAKSVRAGAFVSSLGAVEHVYSDHYDMIERPVLLVLGGRDRIANADVTRQVFFERISSTDKEIRVYDSIAHGEFEYAPAACEQVYPEVSKWIASRTKST